MTTTPRILAVIGGTGNLGLGLAYRWAKAGHHVIIGSRTADKAQAAAAGLKQRLPNAKVEGADNVSAAQKAEIIAVSVPFASQGDTLASIKAGVQGKIVIDTTVCLMPPKVGTVQLPPEGSAGVIAQKVLGADVRVVSAFQNVAAAILESDGDIECDILVCGNDAAACETVRGLAAEGGMQAYYAGPIQNSAAVEGLTSILITLNRKFKNSHAGIRITGLVHG